VPPTGQRPPTEREQHLEELREEAARLGEMVLERAAELIRMREEVAATKKKALEREAKWLKFLEWRKKQDE
jgi:DNA repair ATPase RecN